MRRLHLNQNIWATGLFLFFASMATNAANVLFVSDATDDLTIVTALQGDGHIVTTVTNDYVDDSSEDNVVLQGDLSAHSIIVWSAGGETGSGDEHDIATTNNLAAWVSAGGFLFVTGYDTVASPEDENLIALVGGATSSDDDAALGTIVLANSLSQGVVDLVGIEPEELDDQDSIPLSDLVAGAVCVSGDGTDCSWILRNLGSGQIAYVSSDGESDGDWTDDNPSDEYYAYNAAVRNFVAAAVPVAAAPGSTPIPTLSAYGLAFTALGLILVATRRLRISPKRD